MKVSATAIAAICRSLGIPEAVPEFRFHPTRPWRFDYAWPSEKVALEVEGGAWTKGRHTRGKGFLADMEKYNAATILGWRLLRSTPKQLKSGQAIIWIADFIKASKQEACRTP